MKKTISALKKMLNFIPEKNSNFFFKCLLFNRVLILSKTLETRILYQFIGKFDVLPPGS